MKQIKSNLTGAVALGLLTFTAMTGRAADSTSSASAMMDAPPPSKLHPVTVGVEFGTTGPGVAANWRFMDHLGVGGGIDYLEYSRTATIQGVNIAGKLRFMSEPLTLDWYPWENNSFHISIGGVFNQNQLTGTGVPNAGATYVFNGTTYTAASVGALNLSVKQQPIDPYLGIGWNYYFGKAHHWSLAGTLGVIYTGDPRVSLTPSNPAFTTIPGASANLAAQQQLITHYAKDLEFYPVLKLGLNYSF